MRDIKVISPISWSVKLVFTRKASINGFKTAFRRFALPNRLKSGINSIVESLDNSCALFLKAAISCSFSALFSTVADITFFTSSFSALFSIVAGTTFFTSSFAGRFKEIGVLRKSKLLWNQSFGSHSAPGLPSEMSFCSCSVTLAGISSFLTVGFIETAFCSLLISARRAASNSLNSFSNLSKSERPNKPFTRSLNVRCSLIAAIRASFSSFKAFNPKSISGIVCSVKPTKACFFV